MREEDNPVVADELVEIDWSVGGLGLEIGSSATQTELLCTSFGHCGVLGIDISFALGMVGYAWRGRELRYLEVGCEVWT